MYDNSIAWLTMTIHFGDANSDQNGVFFPLDYSVFRPDVAETSTVKFSLRSWRYCVVVEWDLAAEPL